MQNWSGYQNVGLATHMCHMNLHPLFWSSPLSTRISRSSLLFSDPGLENNLLSSHYGKAADEESQRFIRDRHMQRYYKLLGRVGHPVPAVAHQAADTGGPAPIPLPTRIHRGHWGRSEAAVQLLWHLPSRRGGRAQKWP